jgi:ParB-like chromosome segregation protein Spo0J
VKLSSDPRWQLMPEMSAGDFADLKASIAKHGYWPGFEVLVTPEGVILEGHHRARACAELGIIPPTRTVEVPEAQRWDYVWTVNVQRRHLDHAQRRALIREYLRRHEEESDRGIAKLADVSPTTVGKLRREEGLENPERVQRGRNGQPDYQHAENFADHRHDVWAELTIGYAAPSGETRRRAGLPYAQASERVTWGSGRIYLTTPAPQSDAEFASLLVEAMAACQKRAALNPLETMRRRR